MEILDREDLKKILSHRCNALKIDMVHFDPEKPDKIIAIKHIEQDEPDFEGHFPGNPIYPGYCLDECFNLAAAAMIKLSLGDQIQGLPIIRGKEFVKYGKMVKPGDVLTFFVKLKQRRDIIFVFEGHANNQEGEVVMTASGIKGVAFQAVTVEEGVH